MQTLSAKLKTKSGRAETRRLAQSRPVPFFAILSNARNASLTAALLGKAAAISGSNTTTLDEAAARAAYFPRTRPPGKSERLCEFLIASFNAWNFSSDAAFAVGDILDRNSENFFAMVQCPDSGRHLSRRRAVAHAGDQIADMNVFIMSSNDTVLAKVVIPTPLEQGCVFELIIGAYG